MPLRGGNRCCCKAPICFHPALQPRSTGRAGAGVAASEKRSAAQPPPHPTCACTHLRGVLGAFCNRCLCQKRRRLCLCLQAPEDLQRRRILYLLLTSQLPTISLNENTFKATKGAASLRQAHAECFDAAQSTFDEPICVLGCVNSSRDVGNLFASVTSAPTCRGNLSIYWRSKHIMNRPCTILRSIYPFKCYIPFSKCSIWDPRYSINEPK